MKFVIDDTCGIWNVIIEGEKYCLCACVNCEEVHALHENHWIAIIDKKYRCCDNPDNFYLEEGAEELVEEFVKKYNKVQK